MDLLPWTNLVLSHIGLNETREHEKRWRTNAKKIINYIIYSTLVAGIIHTIAMLCQRNKVVQLLFILFNLPFFSMTLVCYYFICTRINSFYTQLRISFGRLPGRVQKRIRKREKWALLVQVLYLIIPAVVSRVFLNESMMDQGLLILFTNTSFIETSFFLFFYFIGYFVAMWTIFLYIVSLDTASLCAEFTRTKVERIVQRKEITVFAQIQLELEETSRLVNKINEALGMIPLNLFMELFLEILLGVSMGCVKNEINGGQFFGALGPNMLCHVTVIVIVVIKASSTLSLMKETSIFVRQITLMKLPKDCEFSVLEERRALIEYLNHLNSDSITAGPFFKLEPSVLLNFLNVTVAFTVMLITGLQDILKANSTQNCQSCQSCNSTQ